MGQKGFSSRSALLYHRHSPAAITAIEAVATPSFAATPDHPLTPRHLRTGELAPAADLVSGRRVLLANADLRIGFVSAGDTSPLYRNATGDELLYVQQGSAMLESVFGAMRVEAGDYVVVPAGTTHRWVPDGRVDALVVEARGHINPPRRYLSSDGQFLEHAPYCERDLRAPDRPLLVEGEHIEVLVRSAGGLSRQVARFLHAH